MQGGTFKNDAILRAMEQHTQKKITRAPYSELMGAIGVAILTMEQAVDSLLEVDDTPPPPPVNNYNYDDL